MLQQLIVLFPCGKVIYMNMYGTYQSIHLIHAIFFHYMTIYARFTLLRSAETILPAYIELKVVNVISLRKQDLTAAIQSLLCFSI